MYEAFFQLKSRPFLAAPRVDRYFPGAAIETARRNLTRAVERAEGPGLLVGPAGTGKSLLCQVLAEQFKQDFQVVHFSSARLCTRRAMLQAILYELELPYREKEEGELRLALIDHLTGGATARPNLLFIVDEAHALPLRLLEEMRMITNLLRQGQPCVRLALAGSPALEERFASPKLESFNQRIAARCYLDSFDQHDTYQYVCAQMTASGRNAHDVFSDGALEAIYRATDGVPRLINQVCDHALLLAHAHQSQRVEAESVEEAWAELQQLPAPWISASKPKSAEPSVAR
jgi:type II secretory pathway predicted ATPase ExeA